MDVGIILRFPYTRCACKIYNANQYNFSRKSNYTTVETDNDMSKKSCSFYIATYYVKMDFLDIQMELQCGTYMIIVTSPLSKKCKEFIFCPDLLDPCSVHTRLLQYQLKSFRIRVQMDRIRPLYRNNQMQNRLLQHLDPDQT